MFGVIDLRFFRNRDRSVGILVALTVMLALSVNIIMHVFDEEIFIRSATGISEDKIVILDAGHGGADSGAVGTSGVLEKELNLAITLLMGKELEEHGYIVVYTRTDDRLLLGEGEDVKGIRKISDLKNRCKVAARYPSAIFVSIHMNSYGDSRYSGLQVYYSALNSESRTLADCIQRTVREELQPNNNRKIKEGNGIYVLENVTNPAVMVECGFLTNEEECKKLSEENYQKQLSFSLIRAIIEYIEEKSASDGA